MLSQFILNPPHEISGLTDYWAKEDKLSDSGGHSWTQHNDGFPVKYSFGNEVHIFTNIPTTKKPGFVYYNRLGKYQDDIMPQLETIFTRISSLRLAKLLHESRISGNALTHLHLLKECYKGRQEEAIGDANFLNRLQLLLTPV